jgi:hypothetical protein
MDTILGKALRCFFFTDIHSLATVYPQKLALTSPTSGGRSVGIVRSQTQAMEFNVFSLSIHLL